MMDWTAPKSGEEIDALDIAALNSQLVIALLSGEDSRGRVVGDRAVIRGRLLRVEGSVSRFGPGKCDVALSPADPATGPDRR